MDRELTVLLIEDEPGECAAITRYVDLTDDVCLIGVTNNTKKAIEIVKDCLPDTIILDLELHKGSGNGLMFLKELHSLNLKIFPYILVTTNNTSPITYEQARELGADFIMSKSQDDYNAENVIEFLRSLKQTLHNKLRNQGICLEMLTTESYEQITKRITKRINAELDIIGINPKVIGRMYLVDAIMLVVEKPIPNICVAIAKKYNKTDYSVERAMQNAINSTWRKTSIDVLTKNYTARINSERGVPTLTEFVCYYANKIKNEY